MSPFSFIQDFDSYLAIEKRHSKHTVIAYVKDVSDYIEFSGIIKEEEVKELNTSIVRAWIVGLKESQLSNRTIQRKLSSVRVFYNWMRQLGIVENNPTTRINGPKVSKRLPVFIKEEHLESQLINPLFSNDFTGIRDRLMFEMFYQTGIRLSELINLKEKDVTHNSIKVLGKRNKERIIPIGSELFILIQVYQKMKKDFLDYSTNLFVLDNGKNLYEKFVYRKINIYLGLVITLEKKSPHVMRHTFATHMLNNGAGIEVLKEILGHANLTATQVYTHNSFSELNKVYNQTHPRGSKLN
jgi:integrase/recombinase XerC